MCMRNRFSTFGKHAPRALCLLAICGLTWACKDDYTLDDEKPSWLNSSIYQSLQNGMKETDANGQEVTHTFQTYLRLLADPEVNPANARPLTEVLNRTGSKTVFAADDEAWNAFFRRNGQLPETNPWHNATSYEGLSAAQKKLLIHTSMLNNAIVMENLASSDGSGQTPPTRGEYMRRFTDVMLTDSITFIPADQVPYAYNAEKVYQPDNEGKVYTPETNYWARFSSRKNGKGVYIVSDSTASMMLHFTAEHMSKQSITDADFAIFMGRERKTSDVHIYDALLAQKDQVAENGYLNRTEKVITPLPNMAEVIRTNGKTNIFSHILDRFSYPSYNVAVTEAYKTLHPEFTDSIFTRHYFAQIGPFHQAWLTGPDGEKFQDSDGEVALKYDPGWNGFYDETDLRTDMAAMFVPSDEILWDYFAEGGGGWQLVLTYSTDPFAEVPRGDYEALYRKIDDIPISTLQDLVNVIMFRSFTGSVPSKMTQLRNDAQEDMFAQEDIEQIDTCMLANNGAVYIMKKVYGPAKYTSVAAPAYISKRNNIIRWAIDNGRIESQDQMKLNYYAYLMAMKSKFTLFLPSDQAMKRYFDPVSFTSQKPRVLELTYTGKGTFPLSNRLLRFDPATATSGEAWGNENISNDEIVNRLKDILESHTIVHDGTNPIDSEDEYYLTKNGSAIKMTRDANNRIIKVQGGYQLENERAGLTSGDRGTISIEVTPENTNQMENGRTYVLDDAPIIPASKSVYGILTQDLTENGPFSEFYSLTESNDEIIKACGLVRSTLKSNELTRALNKYHVFVNNLGGVDQNIQFFNNYWYTVLVPSNEAIKQAVAKGLPTWESILEDYESLPYYEAIMKNGTHTVNGQTIEEPYVIDTTNSNDTIWVKTSQYTDRCLLHADSLRLQAKITFLNNFVRGHFLDNSIFADKSERPAADYVTSSYNNELGVFVKVHCQRIKEGGKTILQVRDDLKDENGNLTSPYLTVSEDYKNIMARDLTCTRTNNYYSPTAANSMNNIIIQGSSFAVIHQINGVLNHTPLKEDGTYDIDFNDESDCKAYLKEFAIPEEVTLKRLKARL